MAGLIQTKGLEEGEIFCKWLKNRFKANKNVLKVTTGATGSGKSYQDLRQAELHYQKNLNRPFPVENICFSVAEVMKRLTSKKLKRGDIIIFEEAGANMGSLDFQSKISKMFGYVLQSFRSMNVGVFFNLPFLNMLNKTARLLLHAHFVTFGIDFNEKRSLCKPFFLQIRQSDGKMYRKYLHVKVNGKTRKLKRLSWSLPSPNLVDAYERKKANFLIDLTKEFTDHLDEVERATMRKLERAELSQKQQEAYDLACGGFNQTEIAKKLGKSQRSISERLKQARKKGYAIHITQNP